jgi:hypothetical protein
MSASLGIPNVLPVFLLVDPFCALLFDSSSFDSTAMLYINSFISCSFQSVCLFKIPAIAVQYSSLLPCDAYKIHKAVDSATFLISASKSPG